MRGPSLTPQEVVAMLRREVARLVALGVDEPAAIGAVAGAHAVSAEKLTRLLSPEPNGDASLAMERR